MRHTYRDYESKTSCALRDDKETRWVNCYRCDKRFLSHQFEVRKCDYCRSQDDPIKVPSIDLTGKEMENVKKYYPKVMKHFGYPVYSIMGREI